MVERLNAIGQDLFRLPAPFKQARDIPKSRQDRQDDDGPLNHACNKIRLTGGPATIGRRRKLPPTKRKVKLKEDGVVGQYVWITNNGGRIAVRQRGHFADQQIKPLVEVIKTDVGQEGLVIQRNRQRAPDVPLAIICARFNGAVQHQRQRAIGTLNRAGDIAFASRNRLLQSLRLGLFDQVCAHQTFVAITGEDTIHHTAGGQRNSSGLRIVQNKVQSFDVEMRQVYLRVLAQHDRQFFEIQDAFDQPGLNGFARVHQIHGGVNFQIPDVVLIRKLFEFGEQGQHQSPRHSDQTDPPNEGGEFRQRLEGIWCWNRNMLHTVRALFEVVSSLT